MGIPCKQSYVLAIDLGTHGPKVGIVSDRGEVIGWEFEPAPYHLVEGGGVEEDPNDWWQAIVKATNRLVNRDLVPVDQIRAIGPSAQWITIVALDRSGRPLMNAITWMDVRGARYNQAVMKGFPAVEGYSIRKLLTFLRIAGNIPMPSGNDSIGHVLFIKNERPEIYHQVDKFLEVKDYINYCLTGRIASSFEAMQCFTVLDTRRIDRIDYAPNLLKLLDLPREKLPDLKRATDVLGTLTPQAARELGLLERTEVILGTPDIYATAIGAGTVQNFETALYLGTSLFLTCHVPYKRADIQNYIGSCPSAVPGQYMLPQTSNWAAGCLDYFLESLVYPGDSFSSGTQPEDAFARLAEAVKSTRPGSGKLLFIPWLSGEIEPINDANVRGGFFNLSPETSRSHLARAIMEGVAYNGRWILKRIETYTGRRMNPIKAVGGGAVSPTWMQIFADVFDRTIHQMKEPRLATLKGAAFLALAGAGCIQLEQVPSLVQVEQVFTPDPNNRKIYDALFAEFMDFYKRNKAAYARLNKMG